MLKSTFYIASPLHNKIQVREVAEYFESRGLRWANNHDWSQREIAVSSDQSAVWAAADIKGAIAAELFLLLLKGPSTPGAHTKLGARWALGKEIHIVRQGADWHLFHDLPGIIEHLDLDTFLTSIFVH